VHKENLDCQAGLALDIGRGYDDLGPIPVGGPKKIMVSGLYRNIWFLGVYIAKFTEWSQLLIWWRAELKLVNDFSPFEMIFYIYPIYHKDFCIHPPFKKNWLFLIIYQKFIIKEIGDIFLGPLFLIMCLTNIKNICDIYYPRNWKFFITKQIKF